MKNINLNLDFKSLTAKFKTNTVLVFYIILAIILIYELSIFYTAAKQVSASRQVPEDLAVSRGVRLRLSEYQEAANRIQDGRKFYPGAPIFGNPFGTN